MSSLRRLLRTWDVLEREWRHRRASAPAQVSDNWERWRIWSFIHIADAASATVAALEGDALGVFNVTDDEPAPVAAWLPVFAAAVGAKPPLHLYITRLARPPRPPSSPVRHDDRCWRRVECEARWRSW